MLFANSTSTAAKSNERTRRPTLDELDRLMAHFEKVRRQRPRSAPMTKLVAFAGGIRKYLLRRFRHRTHDRDCFRWDFASYVVSDLVAGILHVSNHLPSSFAFEIGPCYFGNFCLASG
jgi:hypothetical protein